MATLTETLVSYVPRVIVEDMLTLGEPPNDPSARQVAAAVLVADISGFTALTEEFVARGSEGAEILSRQLNAYFGQLIDVILTLGGDIVKFAGDSLVAVWPGEESDEALLQASLRAAQCALLCQVQLRFFDAGEGQTLSLRLGVAVGEVLLARLGGVKGRWHAVLGGEPVQLATRALRLAEPGQVICPASCWEIIEDKAVAEVVAEGEDGFWRLRRVTGGVTVDTVQAKPIPLRMAPALRAFIPTAIKGRIQAGQSDWLAETRIVTVLVINLPGLGHQMQLDEAQGLMRVLQTIIYRHEGSVNRVLVDDKGVTLLAGCGLPLVAHKDDAARAVKIGFEIKAALERLDMEGRVGIGTGRAFCGSVGNDKRRTYMLTGGAVNLASRLMSQAGEDGMPSVLCDQATYQQTKSRFEFDMFEPRAIGAGGRMVSLYTPVKEQAEVVVERRLRVVGREQEQEVLQAGLRSLQEGETEVILITGEAGIGKTSLVEDMVAAASNVGIMSLVGAGDAVERSRAYHGWQSIFAHIFGVDLNIEDPTVYQDRILLRLREINPDLMGLAPLLNVVLPVSMPESGLVAAMKGEIRARNTQKLLLGIIQRTAAAAPLVLILDDTHWLDSASWQLCRLVVTQVRPLLLVVVSRPWTGTGLPNEYIFLQNREGTQTIELNDLAPEAIRQLVCRQLGVATVPDVVLNLIQKRAKGHPFFSEELAHELREAGVLKIRDGKCEVVGSLESALPETLAGVIGSRMKHLGSMEQLILQMGSVIGRSFPYQLLHDVFPESERENLRQHLDHLAELDITPVETPEPDLTYLFKHIITQEVAYNSMTLAVRQKLHRAVATWYEEVHGADLSPYYGRLAYHWDEAGEKAKGIDYWEKMGLMTMQMGAYEEAIHFFQQLLDMDPDTEGVDGLRRARWSYEMGTAFVNLGNLGRGEVYINEALAVLGWPMPETRRQLMWGIMKQVWVQFRHRMRPRKYLESRIDETELLLLGAEAHERRGIISFYSNNSLMTLYTALRTLNLAELADISPALARGYGNMAAAAGIAGLHRLGKTYVNEAEEILGMVEDMTAVAWVGLSTSIFRAGIGDWSTAELRLRRSARINEEIGDRRRWDEVTSSLIRIMYFQGRFGQVRYLTDKLEKSAREREDGAWLAVAALGRARVALVEGDLDLAVAATEDAERFMSSRTGNTELATQLEYLAMRALARWRQGDGMAANVLITQVQAMLPPRPTAYYLLAVYAMACEVSIRLWATDQCDWGTVKAFLKELRRYTRLFPIGKPRLALCEGMIAAHQGKGSAAVKQWQAGMEAAESLHMLHDMGWLHVEMGRHLGAETAQGREQLQKGVKVLVSVGASYGVKEAKRLLAEG
ncbi:MAG TPA: AAA family ATPase [Anaerolineae bacterium]|nr:AAA family ATPase [Anaerolineae bacterium]